MTSRGKWVSGAITLIAIGSNIMVVGFNPDNAVLWVFAAASCTCLAATWLWVNRRPLIPDRIVNILDPRELLAANRELRRRRPWTCGPLHKQWAYPIHILKFPIGIMGTYHWKTREDRWVEKQLKQCCGMPDGQRCPSHGGSDDVAR